MHCDFEFEVLIYDSGENGSTFLFESMKRVDQMRYKYQNQLQEFNQSYMLSEEFHSSYHQNQLSDVGMN